MAASPTPTLAPTRASTLALLAVGGAAVGWFVMDRFAGELPPLPWLPLVTLLVLAVTEAATAQATRARIARLPGARPVEPLAVARLVALAKASALVGAAAVGVFGGLTLWLAGGRDALVDGDADLLVAIGGVVTGALLVGGALLLERACRIPPSPEDEDGEPPAARPVR